MQVPGCFIATLIERDLVKFSDISIFTGQAVYNAIVPVGLPHGG
jgi:hypothetical protein